MYASAMRVLLVHSAYLNRGGEDSVVEREASVLRENGVELYEYRVSNEELVAVPALAKGIKSIWNADQADKLRQALAGFQPDVVHLHNTFPLISPAAVRVAKDAGAATVQTLHNYRLLCLSATLRREGKVCEDCVGKAVPWPGVVHSCYRDSRSASAVVAAMLVTHRVLGTYRRLVDVFIAPTEFVRQKMASGGLPAAKIAVKPHFLSEDPGAGDGGGGYALFVGRLSEEKGLPTLLEAWRTLGSRLPLKIAGDGPLMERVMAEAATSQGVHVLGALDQSAVVELMKRATVLLLPSESYETFGLVAIEAFATGLPVVASRLGAIAEIVKDGETGLHFSPGDVVDLRSKVEALIADPARLSAMRVRARTEFLSRYTAERNFADLIDIYSRARMSPVSGETGRH